MMQKSIQVIHPTYQQPDVIRMAAYVRVSSMSEDQLHSFHAQYDYYYKYITSSEKFVFVDIYADEGLTGTKRDKRDEFNRLIRDCRDGKIDRVIVKSIARFARNIADSIEAIRLLKSYGVSVYFEDGSIDTAALTDETLFTLKSIQAQHESVAISKNVRWGYKKRMQAGEFVSSKAPLGYTLDKYQLELDEAKAPIVRRIFSEYLNGKGETAIANGLNRDNIPTAAGNRWVMRGISDILKNEKYTGDALLQKTFTTESLPFTQKKNRGEVPQYYLEASHEPIVSKEDFYKAQDLLEWRSSSYRKQLTGKTYSLSSKLVCAECGHTFKRRVSTNGEIAWTCRTHTINAEECPVVNVKEKEIYEAFIVMWNRLKRCRKQILLPVIDKLETFYSPTEIEKREIALLNSRIADVSKQLMDFNELWQSDLLDDELYQYSKLPLEHELAMLRADRRKHLNTQENIKTETLRRLYRIIDAGGKSMTEFNPILFENVVTHISVPAGRTITFHLIGGFTLKEQITRKMRR